MRPVRLLLFVSVLLVTPSRSGLVVEAAFDADRTVSSETQLAHTDVVVIQTNLGNIKIKLHPKEAPKTVANFRQYVDDKHYDGLTFHRVIPNFMIQGGGHDAALTEKKTRKPIKNESGNGLSNVRGSLTMARTADLDSATAQFFINLVDNKNLDTAKYCVFGEVIQGMDVVDKIAKVATGAKGVHRDVPVEPVVIKAIRWASP